MKTFALVSGIEVAVEFDSTLEQVVSSKKAEVNHIASKILEGATEKHSALEKSTWTKKRDQAEAFSASGDPSSCPALALEAQTTARIVAGREPTEAEATEELEALVASILRQALEIEQLQATVIGWRSAMTRLIDELPTVAAVEDFQIVPPV